MCVNRFIATVSDKNEDPSGAKAHESCWPLGGTAEAMPFQNPSIYLK